MKNYVFFYSLIISIIDGVVITFLLCMFLDTNKINITFLYKKLGLKLKIKN